MCLISQNKVLEMYRFTLAKTHKEKAATINVFAAVFLTELLVGSGIAQTVHNRRKNIKHDGQRRMMSLAASANDLQTIVLLKKVPKARRI